MCIVYVYSPCREILEGSQFCWIRLTDENLVPQSEHSLLTTGLNPHPRRVTFGVHGELTAGVRSSAAVYAQE